ncbi:isochorismate synthase DhbC [Lysinibacillus sp. NPDC096418]|uniref:isochorismate synthase DhbC n=1 Tax=Lysinibacillus sp. NPDC096418 TaxID=3364138 RepID=UPI0037FE6874
MIQTTKCIKEKDLLKKYEVGDFFLASPNQTILGKGQYAFIHENVQNGNFPEHVRALLNEAKQDGVENPIAVGAIPFDYRKPIKLIIPKQTIVTSKYERNDELRHKEDAVTYEFKFIPEPSEYMHGVKKGIKKISSGQLDKIVVGRILELTSSSKVNVSNILRNLSKHNTLGYTFAADITEQTMHEKNELMKKTIIGASPELLVSKKGDHIFANPLAGSRPRSKDPIEDERRAKELLESQKDLSEHAVVVKAVKKSLEAMCKSLIVPEKPSLIQTEAMWHLSTEITGELKDTSISSLTLAKIMHPTPAVCGSPTEKAREEICEIEPFDREYFTGIIGWCDQNGDGEWVVTIRCAEVQDNTLRLFAGAGIMSDSKPEDELAETSAKFRTMLSAMNLNNYL